MEFTAEALGDFRVLATVRIEGQSSKSLDVNAAVVEQRVELVLPGGGGPLSSLHFGALYFGEKREIKALLVNNGPAPCSFIAAIADRFDINETADTVTGTVLATGETFFPGKGAAPSADNVSTAVAVCVYVCMCALFLMRIASVGGEALPRAYRCARTGLRLSPGRLHASPRYRRVRKF